MQLGVQLLSRVCCLVTPVQYLGYNPRITRHAIGRQAWCHCCRQWPYTFCTFKECTKAPDQCVSLSLMSITLQHSLVEGLMTRHAALLTALLQQRPNCLFHIMVHCVS